jgi:hypothetical protein
MGDTPPRFEQSEENSLEKTMDGRGRDKKSKTTVLRRIPGNLAGWQSAPT